MYLELMLAMRKKVTAWLLDSAHQAQLRQAGETARGGQEACAHSDRALVMAGGRRMWMECVHLHIMAIILGVDIALISTDRLGDDVTVYCGGDGATLEDVRVPSWSDTVQALPKRPLTMREPEPALAASPACLARPAFPLLL